MSAPGLLEASARARLQIAVGESVDEAALSARARRALRLAQEHGAPVGAALEAAASAERDLDARARSLKIAISQAQFVAVGMVVLPVVFLPAMQILLELPLLAFYGTPAGFVVGGLGLFLLAVGGGTSWLFMGRVDHVGRREPDPGDDEVADLLACCLAAGLPASSALRAVAEIRPDRAVDLHLGALAVDHGHDPTVAGSLGEAVALMVAGDRLGAAAARELTTLAREQRAREHDRIRRRAERLPAQLTVPSVLALLPATVLLLGAPILAAGLAA